MTNRRLGIPIECWKAELSQRPSRQGHLRERQSENRTPTPAERAIQQSDYQCLSRPKFEDSDPERCPELRRQLLLSPPTKMRRGVPALTEIAPGIRQQSLTDPLLQSKW